MVSVPVWSWKGTPTREHLSRLQEARLCSITILVSPRSAAGQGGRLHADVAFINADGITISGGVRDFSLDDAASARAMSENSGSTVALASPGKIGYEARVRVLD
jgi:DeoR/GlpR family transcriptional regulator of sugar metabolism